MMMNSRIIFLVFAVAALLLATDVKSQTTPAHAFVISLGVDTGIPVPKSRTESFLTLGGDIRLQYGLTDRFALTFTTGGYHFFPIKTPGIYGYGEGPIKLGIKKFFTENIYFGAEAGVAYEATKEGLVTPPKLLLAPALGYANKHWDLSVRYESYSGQNYNFGQVALRLGYGFKL